MMYIPFLSPRSPIFGTKLLPCRRFLQHYYRDTFIESHRKPIDVLEMSYSGRLISSMLALIPQSGDFSLCFGRLGLPDRLPFSKPNINWLLHIRSAFRRNPSGSLICSTPIPMRCSVSQKHII
jgi:hypothetical protein